VSAGENVLDSIPSPAIAMRGRGFGWEIAEPDIKKNETIKMKIFLLLKILLESMVFKFMKEEAIENKQSIPFIAAVIHVFSLHQTLIS
jgi:hypothetical protein